jgi:hypothetical protein
VATCTRPTVRHVYSDRTRGELQVAKNNFFCSDDTSKSLVGLQLRYVFITSNYLLFVNVRRVYRTIWTMVHQSIYFVVTISC